MAEGRLRAGAADSPGGAQPGGPAGGARRRGSDGGDAPPLSRARPSPDKRIPVRLRTGTLFLREKREREVFVAVPLERFYHKIHSLPNRDQIMNSL